MARVVKIVPKSETHFCLARLIEMYVEKKGVDQTIANLIWKNLDKFKSVQYEREI